MRTTIPALYILMLGCGWFLASGNGARIKILLAFILLIGALTPLYEINRSIVRTARFYDLNFLSFITFDQYFQNPPLTHWSFVPEFDHPQTLTADDWVSLSIPRAGEWNTKVGTLFNPRLRFLWKSDLSFR